MDISKRTRCADSVDGTNPEIKHSRSISDLHSTRTRCSIDQAIVAEVETYLLLDRYYIDASASELIINKIFLFVSNNECLVFIVTLFYQYIRLVAPFEWPIL